MDPGLSKKNFLIVIISLMTLIMFSVYLFGLRILVLLIINIIAAFVTEFVFQKKQKKNFSKELLITAIIFTLILPPRISFGISIVGIVFGLFFGKLVYGGYGHNIFNPALVGRVFIHASFVNEMRLEWTKPVTGVLGGFGVYIGKSINGISNATPLQIHRWSGESPNLLKSLLGFTEGCIGETSALLLIIIGLIFIYKKIISKEVTMSILITYFIINFVSHQFINPTIISPLYGMLSGDLLFGSIIMASDPITSPNSKEGKIVYGIIIGLVAFFIRSFSLFTGGIMFAILIGNMISPILDISIGNIKKNKTSRLKGSLEND